MTLLLMGSVPIATMGCSGASRTSTAAELRLQREDLVAVSRDLETLERPVADAVSAGHVAWPLVANGLPAHTPSAAAPSIAAASAAATKIKEPELLEESAAASLTGPAAQLAGLFRTFDGLATHGWSQIGAAIEEIEHGSPAGARFARDNVALYIDSVYDGQFTLAQIGKEALAGYRKLGGPAAFGSTLSEAEVDSLAHTYSEPADRLDPHPGVRLGS